VLSLREVPAQRGLRFDGELGLVDPVQRAHRAGRGITLTTVRDAIEYLAKTVPKSERDDEKG